MLVVAAAVTGAWLLGQGVPLHVDAPPLGAQWLPHTGPGTVPAVLIALLVVMRGPELAARLPWRRASGWARTCRAMTPRRTRWGGRGTLTRSAYR